MIDDVERAQRILEGACPDCGKTKGEHTLLCPTDHFNRRLQRLKNEVVKTALKTTLENIKDKKNV